MIYECEMCGEKLQGQPFIKNDKTFCSKECLRTWAITNSIDDIYNLMENQK